MKRQRGTELKGVVRKLLEFVTARELHGNLETKVEREVEKFERNHL